jgi:hypothetical protein
MTENALNQSKGVNESETEPPMIQNEGLPRRPHFALALLSS